MYASDPRFRTVLTISDIFDTLRPVAVDASCATEMYPEGIFASPATVDCRDNEEIYRFPILLSCNDIFDLFIRNIDATVDCKEREEVYPTAPSPANVDNIFGSKLLDTAIVVDVN